METNLGDLNEIISSIQELMDLVTGKEGATVNEFLNSIVGRMDQLDKYIKIFKRHIPYIYRQKDTTYQDGIFEITMPIDHIIQDSVIYFLSSENSVEGSNYLRIHKGPSYNDYLLVRESREGTLINIGPGVITPNRTIFLRLIHSQTDIKKAVVINAMFEQEITVSNINVLNSASFQNKPTVKDDFLISSFELNQLQNNLNTFKNKFIIGTTSPNEALADKPDGTIYFKVEDYSDE
jgi:hypothetical protein